jgi:hypothetical protein
VARHIPPFKGVRLSAFEEESKVFQALFVSMDIARKPEFEDW